MLREGFEPSLSSASGSCLYPLGYRSQCWSIEDPGIEPGVAAYETAAFTLLARPRDLPVNGECSLRASFAHWHGRRDLNPHEQVWNLSCFRYITTASFQLPAKQVLLLNFASVCDGYCALSLARSRQDLNLQPSV